jgi:hypothetical protein
VGLVARTGATAAGTRRHLAARPPAPGEAYDVAVVSLGLNDVIAGRPAPRCSTTAGDPRHARARLGRAARGAHRHAAGGPLPGLPQPLRWYLGAAGAGDERRRSTRGPAGRPEREVLHLEATLGALDAAAMATTASTPARALRRVGTGGGRARAGVAGRAGHARRVAGGGARGHVAVRSRVMNTLFGSGR